MNHKQNAKLNMAQRVYETMTLHKDVYGQIVPVVEIVNMLGANVADIREALKEQGAVNVPASSLEKREAEKQMIDPCVRIANVMYVTGFSADNKELITLNGLSENSFYRLNNNDAIALASHIVELASKNMEELERFGIDGNEIEEASRAIEVFRTLVAKPMVTIGERKLKTTNLAQLFAQLDSTLYDRLDRVMVLFKKTAPAFYEAYRTARNIIYS